MTKLLGQIELFATCCRCWGYLATLATAFYFCRASRKSPGFIHWLINRYILSLADIKENMKGQMVMACNHGLR